VNLLSLLDIRREKKNADQVVAEGTRDIELRHNFLLRKFEYSRALNAVMKPYVARRKPEYTYSLMMELVRREGLKGALAGREENQLCSVLQVVNRYLADSRFSTMMLHVANLLSCVELCLPEH
jgi:U3 small nucleolar RNA-associated protein 15